MVINEKAAIGKFILQHQKNHYFFIEHKIKDLIKNFIEINKYVHKMT